MKRIAIAISIMLTAGIGSLVAQHTTFQPLENKVQRHSTLDHVSIGLRHLVAADHKDRLQDSSKGRLWRDKIRIAIVKVWYDKGWINKWPDQYAAGYILMRGGQPEIDQPDALMTAYQLFYEAARQTNNPQVREECKYLMTNIRLLLQKDEVDTLLSHW